MVLIQNDGPFFKLENAVTAEQDLKVCV